MLTFGTWSESVRASDTNGTTLWTYTDGQGVDDVWAADLNGDGFDEVIVGYNGGGGVHVVDNQGKRLWKYDKIGNVWHVCAGDLNRDNEVEVVTTSAEGKVYVFDAEGNNLRDIRPACYANMVRMAIPSPSDKALMIFVGGTLPEKNLVGIGLNAEGIEKWRTNLETGSGGTLDSALAAPGAPWMAVLVRGLGLRVMDVNTGKILGEASGVKGRPASVAWMATSATQEPLLLMTTARELIAYRIIPAP